MALKKNVVRDSFPSVLIPQEVKTWLQLRYFSIQEEARQGCAASKLTIENEIVPEDFVSQVGKAISHGFDLMEQLKIAGTLIELCQLPVGFPRQCVRGYVVLLYLSSADWFIWRRGVGSQAAALPNTRRLEGEWARALLRRLIHFVWCLVFLGNALLIRKVIPNRNFIKTEP